MPVTGRPSINRDSRLRAAPSSGDGAAGQQGFYAARVRLAGAQEEINFAQGSA